MPTGEVNPNPSIAIIQCNSKLNLNAFCKFQNGEKKKKIRKEKWKQLRANTSRPNRLWSAVIADGIVILVELQRTQS